MLIETLSTFPAMYDSVMGSSMMKRAQEKGLLSFRAYDLRDWTHDRHRTTDDEPYGGGQGLVMKCEPIFEAYDSLAPPFCRTAELLDAAEDSGTHPGRLHACPHVPKYARPHASAIAGTGALLADSTNDLGAKEETLADATNDLGAEEESRPYTIFLAPTGEQFTDAVATDLARKSRLLFICGHYEGIDERAYVLADRVLSIGDYVLTSGELASMVVIDAVVRKIPGVLGAEEGAVDESFNGGLLEYPQYTRPATFRGMEVPPVLLSGNHAAIASWRRQQSVLRTAACRPDLLAHASLTPAERDFLESLPDGAGSLS